MPTIDSIEIASKELETILTNYMQKKIDGTLGDYDADEYEQIQNCLDRLKDLQANSYISMRDSKQSTSDAKDHMDKKQVELQDVISVYQDVELIPIEEFQSKAGPEYLIDSDNPHQLMINRLKYELVVRAELKEQKEALEQRKVQLIKENIKVQRKVDQFDKLLDDFVESTGPVIEALTAEEKVNMVTEQEPTVETVDAMDTTGE
ncbi:hypothetical protein RMATCC62417_05193 [Rhizopus microsporus]|nr:hypothetical protein RMATCC62417_05193 [Rhizopus microsporus]